MIIHLLYNKTLYISKKEGIYYHFLSNTPSPENEAELLKEYGIRPEDLRHKEAVVVSVPIHVDNHHVFELLEMRYRWPITEEDLWDTLEYYYGHIGHIDGWRVVLDWFNNSLVG